MEHGPGMTASRMGTLPSMRRDCHLYTSIEASILTTSYIDRSSGFAMHAASKAFEHHGRSMSFRASLVLPHTGTQIRAKKHAQADRGIGGYEL